MNEDLTGKLAIVCGSTQGIGKAAAMELAWLGASVVLVSRDKAKLERVLTELPKDRGGRHALVAADFGDTGQVERAAAEVGRRAAENVASSGEGGCVLVNNAGGPAAGPLLDAKAGDLEAAFRVHVLASQALTRTVVPAMKAAKYGRVINIISTSVKAPIPGLGVSNVIRGAMASWAKTLAGELGPFGITVNNVLPGFTSTERLESLIKGRASKPGASEESVKKEMLGSIPAGRFAEAAEIAAAIAFLASPKAGYVNGINLPVDGGRLPVL